MPLQHLGPVQPDEGEAQGNRSGAVSHRLPSFGRHRPSEVIAAAVRSPIHDLGEERVFANRGVHRQANAGDRVPVELVRPERTFREQRHLGLQTALARCDVEQFQERAVAHHDLARERIGLGQQTVEVAAQQISSGTLRSTSQDCRLCECGARMA